MERSREITQWANSMQQNQTSDWDGLPDLDLYMDQVTTYMAKQLHQFESSTSKKLLTSSMINNYVKNGLIPRPRKKKYSKKHIAMLMMVCALKNVLPQPDLVSMLSTLNISGEDQALYEHFRESQNASFSDTCSRIQQTGYDESALMELAFQLSIEANARRTAAQKIIRSLYRPAPTD
ncbi:MAG: DUF1836 domain-containing protein [Christensenellales bacterium]